MSNNHVEYIISLKDLFSQKIGEATKETDKLNKSVDQTSIGLGGLAKIATGAFAVGGLINFGRSILEVGSNFESAEMGLKTLLKSSYLAEKTFKNIQEDAQKTPFDFKGLLDANKLLIGSGISAEKARKDVLNLGNAIAATGGGNDELSRMSVNLQQIKNVGKATAMDIKQFAFAGVNIYGLLADATGKSTAEVKDMEVSYDLLTYALEKSAEKGGMYYNALGNAMETTKGKMSNLGDIMDNLKNTIFEAFKPIINDVVSGLSTLINKLVGVVKWMNQNRSAVKLAVGVMFTLYTATKLAAIQTKVFALWTMRSTIALGINKIAIFASLVATDGLKLALYATGIAGTAMWSALLLGIPLVIAGIGYLYNKFEGFRAVVQGVWEVIKGLAKSMLDLAIGFYTMDFGRMKKGFNSLFDVGKNFKKGYNDEIKRGESVKLDAYAKQIKDKDQQLKELRNLADTQISTQTGKVLQENKKILSDFDKKDKQLNDSKLTLANAKYILKQKQKELSGLAKFTEKNRGPIGNFNADGTPIIETKSEVSKVQQKQATQIHINIGKLIESQNIKVENATKDFASKLHTAVAEVLLNVVNDANRIATQ